jgi:hypothetical protein
MGHGKHASETGKAIHRFMTEMSAGLIAHD